MSSKPQRLSKIAKEFNVGISTIVDFLKGQDIEVESNPNTKISPEIYGSLVVEFKADKASKEKAKTAGVPREVRETVSMDPVVEPEEPAAPEATAPAPVEEKKEEDTTIRASVEKNVGVNVVGKIDLSASESKKEKPAEPAAKEEPVAKKEEKAEAPKPAAAAKEVKKPAPEEKKKEEKAAPEKPKGPETIRATAQKLTGPTVVGKIELPEKKPVASSSAASSDLNKKRKRKRINKVDVNQNRGGGDRNQRGGGNNRGGNPRGRKGGGAAKPEVSEQEIQREIKETLARLSGGGKSKSSKHRRDRRQDVRARMEEEAMQAELEKSVIKITEFVTVSELASMMNASVGDVISKCMELGIFASINQRLDGDTISLISEEFGYTVDFVSADISDVVEEEVDQEEDLETRPPIVTVMGHVDHGKTSLLDHIRKENVIAGEAGGITQHIGAYRVSLEDGREITFLDTPGHEAFTAMRARGAKVTDVAIIVIAADDSVMPQTKEAINHAQAADVPMVFAFNKIDKDGANADKIREELSQMNILVEDWGGKFQSQEISAKNGVNIDDLLEKVLLEAELLELKANPDKRAIGTVLESSLDKGRGYVSNLLVEGGTMKIGDIMLAGQYYGRVKAMFNERGQSLEEVGPATPVSVLGLNGAPNAGDRFNVMEDEKEAKNIATRRQQLQREQTTRTKKRTTLEDLGDRLKMGGFEELNVIVKGDVDGSIEALADSLEKLSTKEVQVNIIHKAVGAISESDVNLAAASDAIIVGFQVRPTVGARKLAESEEIDIRLYSIIYQAIEELKDAMEGMLSPDIVEQIVGTAEIRETFKISKVGTVAGCYVVEGKIIRKNNIRVIRDGVVIYSGELGSLKRFKDDAKEVTHGYECGLNVTNFNDIKVGDLIESYEEVEVKKTLSSN